MALRDRTPRYPDVNTPFYARTYGVESILNPTDKSEYKRIADRNQVRSSIFRDWAMKRRRHLRLVEPWTLVERVKRDSRGHIVLNKRGKPEVIRNYFPSRPDDLTGGPPPELESYLKEVLKWKELHWLWAPLQEAKHGRFLVADRPMKPPFKNSKHASACNIPSVVAIDAGTVTIEYRPKETA